MAAADITTGLDHNTSAGFKRGDRFLQRMIGFAQVYSCCRDDYEESTGEPSLNLLLIYLGDQHRKPRGSPALPVTHTISILLASPTTAITLQCRQDSGYQLVKST